MAAPVRVLLPSRMKFRIQMSVLLDAQLRTNGLDRAEPPEPVVRIVVPRPSKTRLWRLSSRMPVLSR